MSDIVVEMRKAAELRGDTYSSMEIWGLLCRGAAEIERLRAALRGALGMVEAFASGAGMSQSGREEFEGYRRALSGEQEKTG